MTTPTTSNDSAGLAEPTQPKNKKLADVSKPRPERIRTELNIEKWPAIWNPTHSKIHSKGNLKSRTLEREITNPDGTKSVSKVTINPIAQLGDLSTDDQRTVYALIKHWEDRGKPGHETPFSIRHLAKLLNKKGWGTNVIDSVTGSLERLRGTLLIWTRSYRSKDERVEDSETVYINILSKLKIVRRKVDGHITTEAGYFQFDDHILKNLLANYTKPFLFDVFMEIKGEIALKLYSYLDLIMADKQRFERCTKDLFEDLGLKGESYRHPSKRKQNLESAIKELQGITLTTGVLKSVIIEKTKDGKDFKAIFQKAARSEFLDGEQESGTMFAAPEVVINDYSKKPKDDSILRAEELVQYFHKVFHGVDNHSPQSKETGQALNLISKHGLETAKRIVEFAQAEAARTKFDMQHFGGVLNYASRAVADLERWKKQEEKSKLVMEEQSRRFKQEPLRYERGERRLAALTAEQYRARFEKTRAELYVRYPNMAQFVRGREDNKIHEGVIRSRMIRELEVEEMDLLVIE